MSVPILSHFILQLVLRITLASADTPPSSQCPLDNLLFFAILTRSISSFITSSLFLSFAFLKRRLLPGPKYTTWSPTTYTWKGSCSSTLPETTAACYAVNCFSFLAPGSRRATLARAEPTPERGAEAAWASAFSRAIESIESRELRRCVVEAESGDRDWRSRDKDVQAICSPGTPFWARR
jgi:hypothetical protein